MSAWRATPQSGSPPGHTASVKRGLAPICALCTVHCGIGGALLSLISKVVSLCPFLQKLDPLLEAKISRILKAHDAVDPTGWASSKVCYCTHIVFRVARISAWALGLD